MNKAAAKARTAATASHQGNSALGVEAGGTIQAMLARQISRRLGAKAPPSVLPDISPSRGEIGSLDDDAFSLTLAIGESRRNGQSPPLRGRCPAGQRGVPRRKVS